MPKLLGYSSVTVINVNDGVNGENGSDGIGLLSSEVSYTIYPFNEQPPNAILIDENADILVDENADILYNFLWSETIPETIPPGWYLWSKTTLTFTDGSVTETYSVSRNGEQGERGDDGQDAPKILRIVAEYRISNSNENMSGSGYEYNWHEERPEIEPGKYLWTRYRTELEDGYTFYSDASCDTTLSGVILDVNNNKNAIESKVWQTDITTTLNEYDNTTGAIIRDRVSQTEQNIDGITSTVSDMQTTVANKADGSAVEALTSRISETEQDVSGFKQTVSETYAVKSSIPEFIVGTQTSSTNSWQGKSNNINSLSDGQQITYWLPYNGNGQNVTFNLLFENDTSSGDIPVYYDGTSRLTTEYTNGNIIHLVYRENVIVGDTQILNGWWANANYDSGNTFDRMKFNGAVKANVAIVRGNLIVSNGNYFYPLNSGDSFGINYPILYTDSAITANGMTTECYTVIPMSITTTQPLDLTSGIALYIKGTLNGLNFRPINSSPITQVVPTTEDNYHYMLLGMAFGTGNTTRDFYLQADHPIYIYKNGQGFVRVETAALSIAEQTSAGFKWIVKSGTSATNFELTDRTADLVSNYINLHGLVSFNGLNTAIQNKINSTETTANQAASDIILVNTSLDAYRDANSVVIGTQNSETGLFTGNAKFALLQDGQQITYWLPYGYSETGAIDYQPVGGTLEKGAAIVLTLNSGATTDPIPCFFNGLERLTDQYSAGNIIRFVYRENVTIDGKQVVSGMWADANYDSGNTFDRIRYQQNITATSNITYNHIIVGYNGGYHNLNNGQPFDITYPILWCGNTLTANHSGSNNFICIPFSSTDTQNTTWAVGKPVFIKGSLNGSIFTPVNTTPMTQTIPTSDDGYYYILVGSAYATTGIYLTFGHDIYKYYDGAFKSISQIATEAAVTAVAARTVANSNKNWIENLGTNATEILATWTADASLESTVIDGGYLKTNTVQARHLATDAIMSNNYVASENQRSPFSAYGTFLNLENGNFYTPNFGIDNLSGTAYLNGEIVADSGSIGSDNENYWEIGTKIDYDGNDSAALIGHGTSYIQSGWWQVSNNKINTVRYNSNHSLEYLYHDYRYWDYGMQVPSFDSQVNGADAWLYIRRSVDDEIPTIAVDWDYLFKVDKDGNIYEKGVKLSERYASIDSVDSVYLLKTGGTISGDLVVQGSITGTASSALSLNHTLSINGTTWNGNADTTIGTIGVGYGGTGVTTWVANRLIYSSGAKAMGNLAAGTAGQILKSNGSSAAPSWVDPSTLSADVALNATNDGDGNEISTTYRKLTNNTFTQIAVTGQATFTGGISGNLTGNVTGNLTGNASSANQVKNNLKIQLNGGTTEGTNQFTYNGSGVKNINITKASIGLGNVANTADANKVVASAGKLTNPISITIGSTSVDFDGSSDIEFTLSDIGAQPIGNYITTSGGTITGTLVLSKTTDLAGTSNNSPALIVGGTASQAHIEIDANEIHAKANGNTAGTLNLNLDGGTIALGRNANVSANGTITATAFSGNATSATTATSAGKLTQAQSLTIGNTSKDVDWSGAVSFSKTEISGNATNSVAGWMSAADKKKLDSISISDIGSVGANTIIGEKDITVTINNGVATIGHSNASITAGTASGTSNSGNLAFGATVTLPSVTFDSYGHITAKGTTTFKLPAAPTTITGNAGTATKLKTAVNISVGKSTKSFDGSTAISFATNDIGIAQNDIKPLETKTYTGWLGTSSNNAANDSFYFLKTRPTTFNSQWKLRYRITVTIPSQTNFYATSDVTLYGYGQASVPAYSIFNTHYNTSYRPYYYHNFYRLNATGYSGNCWNAVGLGLRNSNSRDTSGYERTVVVEVLETKDCSYDLLDSGVKWSAWESAASNYAGLTEYDGYNNGLRETGDDNDTSTQRAYYARLTAGTNGIKMYSLIMKDGTGKWQSLTTNSGTGTTKTKNTTGFVLGNVFYMNRSTDIGADGVTGNNEVSQYVNNIDLRYSTNCGSTVTVNKPMFIKGTMSNGLFYLADTWWTQTVPTTKDGFVYIPIGTGYNTTQIDFITGLQPIYHNGTGIVPYNEAEKAKNADYALSLQNTSVTSSGTRPIWFSNTNGNNYAGFNTNFTYNPSGNIVKATTFDGNATSATKATQDGSGRTITSTYIPFSGTVITNPNTSTFSLGNAISGSYLLFSNTGNTDGVAKGIGGVVGGNDGWVLRGYQTAANKGNIELATGDDGDEGIYVRQYYGSAYRLPFMNLAGSASGLSYRELVLMEPSTGCTRIKVTTASTSKTTGALTVGGGVGVSGAVHAGSFSVNDKVNLTWNSTTESLDFVFV